jgi:hypothetical protein
MGFLPPSYEPPTSGNYAKLQAGENRFRILGPALVGNMFWSVGIDGKRKPVRRRDGVAIHENELGLDSTGKPERIRHFWAIPVWSRASKQVQILEITQSTLQSGIYALCQSDDWGDPTGYDIIIHKSGTGMDTEYKVLPGRAAPTEPDILNAYHDANLNMQALYEGGDPFAGGGHGGKQGGQAPANAGMTLDQAIAAVAKVAMSKDELIAHLKANGKQGWNSESCTPIVQALIRERGVSAPSEGPHKPVSDDEIPF